MFWGLVIEPGKKYTQTVENSFHISKAALELTSGSNADEDTTLMLDFEGQQEYILCHLNKKVNKQESLDLNFQSGDSISIFTHGSAAVHLSGYLLGDDDDEDMTLGDMLEEEEEDEEEEDESMEMEVNLKGNKRALPGNGMANSKKKKKMEDEESDEDEEGEEEEDDEEEEKPKPPVKPAQQAKPKDEKNKPKPLQPQQQQKQKQGNEAAKGGKPNKEDAATGAKAKSAKKTLTGGLVVEDLKTGNGPEAVSNKKVGVYYVGRLQQGKVFDQCSKGQPFKFRLGAGEVIKGWDMGIAGMKVGGKRRLTIPAHLAYGKKGAPPEIPPNSTLMFDVELKAVQ